MIYKTITIPSFGGGLNKYQPEIIGDDQASVLNDVFPREYHTLISRRFRVKQHSSVLGAGVHGIFQHLGDPTMVFKVGQQFYDNFLLISTGLHLTNLISGVSWKDKFLFTDGVGAFKFNRSDATVVRWGAEAPSTTCTPADGGAGNLSGSYCWKATFYNDSIETIASPVSGNLEVEDKQVTLTNIPVSPDTHIIGRKIYRTAAGGTVYYYVGLITNNIGTSFTDDVADDDLGAELDTNNNLQAPSTCRIAVLHFLRVYMCGDTSTNQTNWIWFSEPLTGVAGEEYFGVSTIENYLEIGDITPVTSILPQFRSLLAFKRNEIWVCEGTVPSEMYITPTLAKRGAVAPFAVATHTNPIFTAWDSVCGFDGRKEDKLIEYTDPIFDVEIDKDYLHLSPGVVWRGKYLLGYTELGYTNPNKILVLDLDHKNAAYILPFGANCFAVDTKGELWCGDSSGWVRKLEQVTNTDGESLNLTYRSKKFALAQTPGEVGGFAKILFNAKTGSEGGLFRVYLDGTCIHEGSFSATSLTTFRKKLPPRFGRYIQVEFVYTGTGEFMVVPPVVINPSEEI